MSAIVDTDIFTTVAVLSDNGLYTKNIIWNLGYSYNVWIVMQCFQNMANGWFEVLKFTLFITNGTYSTFLLDVTFDMPLALGGMILIQPAIMHIHDGS